MFFIEPEKFSSSYFLSSVGIFLSLPSDSDDSGSSREATLIRIYTEIELQIKKFKTDVALFVSRFPNRKIDVSLDFSVDKMLKIQDSVTFSFPIGSVPEIYAEDLFKSYGLPIGELSVMYSFYVREEILAAVKKALLHAPPTGNIARGSSGEEAISVVENSLQKEDSAVEAETEKESSPIPLGALPSEHPPETKKYPVLFQKKEPKVFLKTKIESLQNTSFTYESKGKLYQAKETQEKRKKKKC